MGYERHSFSQAQGYEEIPGPLRVAVGVTTDAG